AWPTKPSGADGVTRADDPRRAGSTRAGAAHRVRLSRESAARRKEMRLHARPRCRLNSSAFAARAVATPPACAQAAGRAHVWEGSARAGQRPSTTRVGNPVAELSIELIETLRPVMARIKARDKALEDQIRRAASSVTLNIGEGEYSDPGNRRARYFTAAGSAGETLAAVRVALAW